MEEKKEIAIRPYVIIVVILLVFSLIIALIFVGNKLINANKDIDRLNNDIEDLSEEINKLRKTISEDMGEYYIEEYDFFGGNSDSVQNTIDYSKNIKDFSDDEIRNTIEKFLSLKAEYYNSKTNFLIDLGLTDRRRADKYYNNSSIADEFYLTDIKYDDYKNELINYMTEECFHDNFTEDMKMKNDMLYMSYVTASDPEEYEIQGIEKVKDNFFRVDTIRKTSGYDDEEDEEDKEDIEYDFAIELVSYNGKLYVQYIDFFDNYTYGYY